MIGDKVNRMVCNRFNSFFPIYDETEMLPVLLTFVFGVSAIQSTEAAEVSVKPDPFAGFSLDIDGDWAAELRRFKPKTGAVAFDLTADRIRTSS